MSENIIHGVMTFANQPEMNWLTFMPCGLKINLKTGEVEIPEGLSLDDASRAFWEGLNRYRGA